MRKIMIPIIFLLVLLLSGCGAQYPVVQPIQPTPYQPAAQVFAPTVTPTLTTEESLTLVPFTPIRGEQMMIETAALEQSAQGQWSLRITGQIPTPCHEIKWKSTVEGKKLIFTFSASQKAGSMCAQVITDYELTVPIEDLSAGNYQVYIDGTFIGEIQV